MDAQLLPYIGLAALLAGMAHLAVGAAVAGLWLRRPLRAGSFAFVLVAWPVVPLLLAAALALWVAAAAWACVRGLGRRP